MVFDLKTVLLGFEDLKQMRLKEIDDLFVKFENVDNDNKPSFTLVNPFLLRDYDFEVPNAIKELLELNDDTQIRVYNIMITKQPLENSEINFAAPFIFNMDKKLVAQVILDSNRYPEYKLLDKISTFLKK
jgi:flagellar assembly factor FliW